MLGVKGHTAIRNLLPLQNKEQLLALLDKKLRWSDTERSDLVKLLDESSSLLDTLKSPFVSSLFANSWKSQTKNFENGRVKRKDIYLSFIEVLLTATYCNLLLFYYFSTTFLLLFYYFSTTFLLLFCCYSTNNLF